MAQQTRDFKRLNEQLLHGVDVLLASWLPGGKVRGSEFMAGDIYGGTGDSLKVNVHTGKWADFANPSHSGGDLISLYATIHGISQAEAYDRLANVEVKPNLKRSHIPEKNQAPVYAAQDFSITAGGRVLKPTYIHRYADPSGTKHPLVVCRYDKPDGKKTYRPYALNGSGYLAQNIPDNRPLYNLDLITKHPDKPILVVEGEKSADFAQSVLKAYVVTTWPAGASSAHKADWSKLKGRDVILWPDNDTPGREAMKQISNILTPIASRIRQIDPGGQPEHWDAGDAFNPEDPWTAKHWREWAKSRITTVIDNQASTKDEELIDEMGRPYIMAGFYRKYKTLSRDNKPVVKYEPRFMEMAEHCRSLKTMTFSDAKSLKFNGTHWDMIDKLWINQFIASQNPHEAIKPQHFDGFARCIRALCYETHIQWRPTDGFLNCANGIINTKTRQLLPHSHEFPFRYTLPIDYQPDAEAPQWYRFLTEVFERNVELIDLAQRLFGYIIVGGHPFLHRAFVLYGSGRNGKSTFIDVLRALLGTSCSAVSMSRLDHDFSVVDLDGKLANLVEETPSDAINAEVFKSVVGGGVIQAAQKNHPVFNMRVNARFVFACNEMPVFRDKSIGLEDRLVFIPFNRYFSPEERDTKILDKLLSELPGILNWALDGAELILKDPRIPDYEATNEAKQTYKEETDPVYAWFTEACDIKPDSSFVSLDAMYSRYKDATEDDGHTPLAKINFSRRLRSLVEQRCRIEGVKYNKELKSKDRKQRGFNCIKLKDRLF